LSTKVIFTSDNPRSETPEVIIDDMDEEKVYDYINSLVGKTIEFHLNWYGNDKKIGPVKLDDWDLDMPEDADYPGYNFFINDKHYSGERNVDWFEVDTSKTIKTIK